MLSDPAGAIWLKEYDPGTDSHWVNGWCRWRPLPCRLFRRAIG
jgi:hypothetical protein